MLSIVIPAHNEADRIEPVLRSLRREFPGDEIIVVANACTDRTASLVADQASRDPWLRLIDLSARLGKGGAVRLGLQMARGDVVAFVDADGATPPHELRRLVCALQGADCVIASRWTRGARVLVKQPPLRRFLGRAFNCIVRTLFGLRLADTQCGAKVFRRNALEDIIEDVETADFAFDVDLLYQLVRKGRQVKELPTVWRDRDGSTVDVVAHAPRMLASIVRLRLQHSPCRYVIPFFDRLFGLSAIKCRRLLRILVIAATHSGDAASESVERQLERLLAAYRSDRREVVWWRPAAKGAPALEYLRKHRSRFDCVVEVTSNGHRFWTPLYSLKPILMLGTDRTRLRWPYSSAELLHAVPVDTHAFELAVRRAMTRHDAYFLQENDGSWSFHARQGLPAHIEQHAYAPARAAIARAQATAGHR